MKTTFSTTDLGLSAWIMSARKLRLLSIDRLPGQDLAAMVFDDPDSVGDDLQAIYFSGEGTVSALSYFSQLRQLRRRIHSAVQAEGRSLHDRT
jgi:hypothetical protein